MCELILDFNMVSKSSRKKIAIYGAIAFILSRMADIITTWYYTPNLMIEGNPLIQGRSWGYALTIQAVLIATLMYCCYRIAMADYNKPLQGEWFIKKVAGEEFATPIKRYTFELSFLITAIMAGFLASSSWYLGHTLHLDSVNYFLGLKIGKLPLSMLAIVFIPWIISYKLLDWYFAKQYNPCVN